MGMVSGHTSRKAAKTQRKAWRLSGFARGTDEGWPAQNLMVTGHEPGCRFPAASIDVIRVVVEVRAVVAIAQGVEDLGIDAVFDVVDRAVGERGAHAGADSRPAL